MVQIMLSIGGAGLMRDVRQMRGYALARKVLGLAIVSGGYAVLLAHGLQHALSG